MGIRVWEPTCKQAFVVAKDNRDNASLLNALKPFVASSDKKKISVDLVEGVLGARDVRGVLLYQLSPETNANAFASTVTKIANAMSDGGGASGLASESVEKLCSVPVVMRSLLP